MNAPSIEQLIARIPRSLGSYGPVLEEIENALNSPECSLGSVALAIEKDPDLTARLLRLGNSSFYGFSSRLATVNEAISLIGIQQIQDLIVVSSIVEQFTDLPAELMNMESFWRHSLACGIGARVIAVERRLPKADKFFVAGLLHDVGRLVLFSEAPRAAEAIFHLAKADSIQLREAESRVLGYDHQELGQALLRHWQYPANLVQAVAFHHQPGACEGAKDEAAVVHLADHLVNALRIGSSGERCAAPLQMVAWDRVQLPVNQLSSVIEAIEEQIEAVQEVFLSASRATSPA